MADCTQQMLSSSPYGLCASVFAFATDSEQDCHVRHFEAVNSEGTLLITASVDEDQEFDPNNRDALTVHLKLWSVCGNNEPEIVDYNEIQCSRMDYKCSAGLSSNTQHVLCNTTLKNPFRLTNDIVSFSGDLRYMRICSRLFRSRFSTISTSFEVCFESSSCPRRQIASGGHFLVSACTSSPNPEFSISDSSLLSDQSWLPGRLPIKGSDRNFMQKSPSSGSFSDEGQVLDEMKIDSWCCICHDVAKNYYHCKVCGDGEANICVKCFYLDNWCKDQQHVLSRRTRGETYNEDGSEKVLFSAIPKQEIQLLSTTNLNSKPHLLFSRSSWAAINSHPTFHPLRPIFFWLIDQSQLLVGDCLLESYVIRTLKTSPKTTCKAAELHVSSCGAYLYVISLETLPTQNQAACDPTMKDPHPRTRYLSTYLCYATYALDIEQNSVSGVPLVSLSRTKLYESSEGSVSPCCNVKWTSVEAYVSYLGTDSELHLYKFRLLGQPPRQLQEPNVSNYCDQQAESHQKLVLKLRMDFIAAKGDLSLQFFPPKSEMDCPFLLIRSSSDVGTSSLWRISLNRDFLRGWRNIQSNAAGTGDLQASFTVQASVAPNSDPSRPMQQESTILYSDAVVLSYSLCACCDEIVRNSRLLNDPSQWTTGGGQNDQVSENHSLGTGKQQSTTVIEHLEYDASLSDVRASSLRGCHLCTLFMSYLSRGKHSNRTYRMLTTSSMDGLSNQAREMSMHLPRSDAITTQSLSDYTSLVTEENLRLIKSCLLESLQYRPDALFEQDWPNTFPKRGNTSTLMICVSISEALGKGSYPRGQMILYQPTIYGRPNIYSRLDVNLREQSEGPSDIETESVTKRFLDAYLRKPSPVTQITKSEATSIRVRKWVHRYLGFPPVENTRETQASLALARKWIRNSLLSPRMTKSTRSEATFALARKWICECLSKHGLCNADSGLTFIPPTRLIDVGPLDGSQDPRLYITSAEDQNIRYMTLSHCWGRAEILTLTHETYEQMLSGFSMTILPQSFQDAIEICRRLNQRYLWIDSLCVIQDDYGDWYREAPNMGNIYQNSVCTIAALGASNSFAGLFSQREQPCKLPDEIDLIVRVSPKSLGRDEQSPLHRRAWVFQERLLSPRTLQFGRRGISWECHEMTANEAFIESIPVSRLEYRETKLKEEFAQLRQCYLSATASEEQRSFFSRVWHEIVKTYSELELTFASDKLIAFSGVTDEIRRCTGLTYYYGLWSSSFDQSLFLAELLWSAPFPRSDRQPDRNAISSQGPGKYGWGMRAPTFSWAAIDGPVTYRTTFHDRLYNQNGAAMFNVSKYGGNGGLETTVFFDESGNFLTGLQMEHSSSVFSLPGYISQRRAEVVVLNVRGPATHYAPPTMNNVDYRSTVLLRHVPIASKIVDFPFIVLRGPILQMDSMKERNANGDLVWSHPFASMDCNIIHEQSNSETTAPNGMKLPTKSWPPTNNEDWFHVDTASVEFLPENTTLRLHCLRVARWQSKFDKRWYVTGLVLMQDHSFGFGCKFHESKGNEQDALTRVGLFEYSWDHENDHWKVEEDVDTVCIY